MTRKSLPQLSRSRVDKIWRKTNVLPDGCWVYTGGRYKGYGRIYVDKKFYIVTRVVYLLYYLVDAMELDVLHKCDNPSCVNPLHLYLGTHQDNMRDKTERKRHSGANHWAKRFPDKIKYGADRKAVTIAIRDMKPMVDEYKQGESCMNISRKYGYNYCTVYSLLHSEKRQQSLNG